MSVAAHRVAGYYRHLFHLPTLRQIVLQWLVVLVFVFLATAFVSTNLIAARWLIGTPVLAALPWLVKSLDKDNILFTVRRGLFLQYIQLLLFSGFAVVGLAALLVLGQGRQFGINLLGLSSTFVFVMVIAAGVFFEKIWQALLFSVAQTTAIATIVLDPGHTFSYIRAQPLFALLNLAIVISGIAFLVFLNQRGRAIFKHDPLTVLKYFMQTWSENDPRMLEDWLDEWSQASLVKSYIIKFRYRTPRLLWVIPGIHPGPFAPVGSYNLPARIVDAFGSTGRCMVFHGAAEHDTNLPSQGEVEKFLQTLKEGGRRISGKGELAGPVFGHHQHQRFAALRVDKIAIVFVTYADESIDDLPTWMREEIVLRARNMGYEEGIVVDAHNTVSHASRSRIDSQHLLNGVESALRDLLVEGENRVSIGVASSRSRNLKEDIGGAGISMTVIRGDSEPSAFVVIDSNNIQLEAGKTVESVCRELFGEAFILCTTDTHHNAARVLGRRGYVLAGDRTPVQHLIEEIRDLAARATTKLEAVNVEVEVITGDLKVMGEGVLRRSFEGLSQLAKLAKNTAYVLGLFTLVLLVAELVV